jgi:hypothetical protein
MQDPQEQSNSTTPTASPQSRPPKSAAIVVGLREAQWSSAADPWGQGPISSAISSKAGSH